MKILRVSIITLLVFVFFVGTESLFVGKNVYAQSRPAAKKGKAKTDKSKDAKKEAPAEIKKEDPWTNTGDNILAISFSSNGKSAASVDAEGTIFFWDIESGRKIRTVRYGNTITAAAFFGNKKVGFADGLGKDNSIFVMDLATGKGTRTIAGHKAGVKTLAFSMDGEAILSGGWNNQVVLWGTAFGDIVRVFIDHDDAVNSVSVSPDRVLAASGSTDGKIKIWNMSTGELVQTIKAHKKGVLKVAFSPDGKLILSGGIEKGKDKKDFYPVKLWDVSTGKALAKTNLGEHQYPLSVALFSPNGKYVLSGDRGGGPPPANGVLKLWSVETASVTLEKGAPLPPPLTTFEGHAGAIQTAAFSSDGARVLVAGDGTLTIWETATGKVIGGGKTPEPATPPPPPGTEKPKE